jgi:HrpA-like RNA helicase
MVYDQGFETRSCKVCGKQFQLNRNGLDRSRATGLSSPLRCDACRIDNSKLINKIAAPYAQVKLGSKFPYFDPQVRIEREKVVPQFEAIPGAPEAVEILSKFDPIRPAADELLDELRDPYGARFLMFIAPCGSGKTVYLAYIAWCFACETNTMALITQPRISTMESRSGDWKQTTPGYIASKLLGDNGIGRGHEIGLRHSRDKGSYDANNRVHFVTDGTLINWIISGEISRYSVIIIDEAHEASSNMVLIFALLKLIAGSYPNLRVIIASATIDADRFEAYFSDGRNPTMWRPTKPIPVSTPGRCAVHWPDQATADTEAYGALIPGLKLPSSSKEVKKLIPAAVAEVIRLMREQDGFLTYAGTHGDVVVFLPTIKIVRATAEAVEELGYDDLDIFECHAQRSEEEVERFAESEIEAEEAFKAKRDSRRQRIILATNYAETGVTMNNLKVSIDSGWTNEGVWDSKTCTWVFQLVRAPHASIKQREGRVGRQSDGDSIKLFTHSDFSDSQLHPEEPPSQLAKDRLDQFLLKAAIVGISDLQRFDWFGFDKNDHVQVKERERAVNNLMARGLIDDQCFATKSGVRTNAMMSSNVDEAELLKVADILGVSVEMSAQIAFAQDRSSPFSGDANQPDAALAHYQWKAGCVDDVEFALRVYQAWCEEAGYLSDWDLEKWCRSNSLNAGFFMALERKQQGFLSQFAKNIHTESVIARDGSAAAAHAMRLAVVACLPEWLYKYDSKSCLYYPVEDRCPSSVPISIAETSSLFGQTPECIIPLVRRNVDNELGGRIVADMVVVVEPDWTQSGAELDEFVSLQIEEHSVGAHEEIQRSAERIKAGRRVLDDTSHIEKGSEITVTLVRVLGSLKKGVLAEVRDEDGSYIHALIHQQLPDEGEELTAVVSAVTGHYITLGSAASQSKRPSKPSVDVGIGMEVLQARISGASNSVFYVQLGFGGSDAILRHSTLARAGMSAQDFSKGDLVDVVVTGQSDRWLVELL